MKRNKFLAFVMAVAIMITLIPGKTTQVMAAEIVTGEVQDGVSMVLYEGNQNMLLEAGKTYEIRQVFGRTYGSTTYINPYFTGSSEDNLITFSDFNAVSKENPESKRINFRYSGLVVVTYKITVSQTAKIGKYSYGVTAHSDNIIGYDEYKNPIYGNTGAFKINYEIVDELVDPFFTVSGNLDFSGKAGEIMNIDLSLKNIGDMDAYNTFVTIGSHPSLVPNGSAFRQKAGIVKAGETIKVSYSFRVDSFAETGRFSLPVTVTSVSRSGREVAATEAYIYVSLTAKPGVAPTNTPTPTPTPGKVYKNSSLIITEVKQDVESPKAGEKVIVSFKLENNGDTNLNNLRVSLDGVSDSGFEPVNSDPYMIIGNLKPWSSKEVKIEVKCGLRMPKGTNVLNLSFNAEEENGSEFSSRTSVYVLNVQEYKEPEEEKPNTPKTKQSSLIITEVKQDVESPKAGESVTVSFNLENNGDTNLNNLRVSLDGVSDSGFEPVNSDPYMIIGNLKPWSSTEVKIEVKCGLHMQKGTNVLNLSFNAEDETGSEFSSRTSVYVLNVQEYKGAEEDTQASSRPKLMVTDFSIDKQPLMAGDTFFFTFFLKNTNSETVAKNIKIKVGGNDFSVVAGSNSFFVSEILPGEQGEFTIELKASSSLSTGAYPIQINTEYEYDAVKGTADYGQTLTTTDELLVRVDETLRASCENINVGSWDTPMAGSPTSLSFEFYNMGRSQLNNVYVTIGGDFFLATGNSYYIGNIMAGNPEFVECSVTPISSGDVTLVMTIHMEDSTGEEVTKEITQQVYVSDGSFNGGGIWEPDDPGYVIPDDPGFVDEPEDNKFKAFLSKIPVWGYVVAVVAVAGIVVIVVIAVKKKKKNRQLEEFDD